MTGFIITEILFAIAWIIASMVVWEFYKAKDGILRLIMIWYFIWEIITYLGSGIKIWINFHDSGVFKEDTFRYIILIGKAAIKLWLLWYLKFGRNSNKLVNH